MRWLDKLFRREQADQDVQDELDFHVEMAAAAHQQRGLSPEDARLAALKAIGGIEHRAEECREKRRTRWLEDLLQDITFALRTLRRSPAFTSAAVLSLAGGIGATTIAASALYSILLKPLAFHQPEGLVVLWQTRPQDGWKRYEVTAGNYLDWKRQSTAFADLAALNPFASATITGDGEPERIEGARVSANYFRVLGTAAALGRTFVDGEDTPGREQVAIVSHVVWKRRFNSDPNLVGRTVTLDSRPHTIIGVLPEHFPVRAATPDLETSTRDVHVWRPLVFAPDQPPNREHGVLRVIGRLKPQTTVAAAHAEIEAVARSQAAEHPETNRGWSVQVVPLHDQTSGDLSRTMLIAAGAVGLALVLACVSVAGLLLARAAGRHDELATRIALGATLTRVTRLLMTEALVIAIAGGVGGVVGAWAGLPLLVRQTFVELPRKEEIAISWPVLLFVLFVTIGAGVLFGAVPALRVRAMVGTTRSATASSARIRSADFLIGAQVAISCVLLVGSGLMLVTLRKLHRVDPGFDHRGLLTFQVTLPQQLYREPASRVEFYRRAEERVRTLPGVIAASSSTSLPFMLRSDQAVIPYRLPSVGRSAHALASANAVQPGFFEAMGIRLRAGRVFHARDDRRSPLVILVNEELARQAWPGQSAVGQKISIEEDTAGQRVWREVAGVLQTVRPFGLDSAPQPAFYVPLAQFEVGWQLFAVRAAGDPLLLVPAICREIAALDPRQPIHNVATMEWMIERSLATRRAVFFLVGGLAVLAALFAATGLYALLSYRVQQARREIGIRIALGASVSAVLLVVLRRGLRVAVGGCVAGLACAAVFTRALAGLLYEVEPVEPSIYAEVAALLFAVALLASAIPALRAISVDPVTTLKAE